MIFESQLEKHYWYLYRVGVLMSMLLHASFITWFKYLGATPLAIGNIGSFVAYGLCLKLISDKRYLSVIALSSVELITHSIAAISVLGWTAGFQYYLIMFIPIIFVSAKRAQWLKLATLTGIFAIYSGMFIYTNNMPPLVILDKHDLYMIHLFNMGVCFGFLAVAAHLYTQWAGENEVDLQKLASTDMLTGLLNRRKLIELINYESGRYERSYKAYSVIMADVDNFKNINDTYGHETGDYVLATTSRLIEQMIRKQDSAARWGGEEFLVLCLETELEQATQVATRILNQVNSHKFEYDGMSFTVTLSIGVAEIDDEEQPEKCIARADDALYRAKHGGKNQVCVSGKKKKKPRLYLVQQTAE